PLFPRIDKAKTIAEIDERGEAGSVSTGARQVQNRARPDSTGDRLPPASGQHAKKADAVPTSPNAPQTRPAPPMQHATEADAVPGADGVTNFIDITDFTKVDL